jgi:hypothetical protein
MGLLPYDERRPASDYEQLTNSSGTGYTGVAYGGNPALRVDKLILTTDSDIAITVEVWRGTNSGAATLLGSLNVPPGAGKTVGVPAIDAVQALIALAGGDVLGPNESLGVQLPTAVTEPNTLWVTTIGAYC